MSWELGPKRKEWAEWIKASLKRAGSNQRNVAENITELVGDKAGKTTEVNGFVSGEPGRLQAWFQDTPAWIDLLAVEMNVTPEEVLGMFRRLQAGELPSAPWHPAFPGVELAEVEVPSPLDCRLGRTPGQIVDAWAKLAAASSQPPHRVLTVIGPSGARRDIAMGQLQAALEVLTARIPREQGKVHASDLRVQARDEGEAAGEPSAYWCRLAAWSLPEIATLSRALAKTELPRSQRDALVAFATLAEGGEATAISTSPSLAIWLCAEVARAGCPRDLGSARRLLTAGAWRRATMSAERLDAFDQDLMAAYFAETVRRRREGSDGGGLFAVPREQAVDLLARAVQAAEGAAGGRDLAGLVESLVSARGKEEREAAAHALRAAIVAEPAHKLLDGLVQAGLLREETSFGRRCVLAADLQLATMWAAQGLGDDVVAASDWGLLCNTQYGAVVEEQAAAGLARGRLRDTLRDAPSHLALDASLLALRHAARSPTVELDDQLVADWAAVTWAAAHGFLSTTVGTATSGWCREATEVLGHFTRRYRFQLPRLGADAVDVLAALVPSVARALVRSWRPGPGENPGERADDAWGFHSFSHLLDREELDRQLFTLAPEVFVPENPATWARWRGWAPEKGRALAIEHAERGDLGCRALLSGELWARQGHPRLRGAAPSPEVASALDFWAGLDANTRLEWAARAEVPARVAGVVSVELAHLDGLDPLDDRTIRLAGKVEPGKLTRWCIDVLTATPPREETSVTAALGLAERLKLATVLERVAAFPHAWAKRCMPRLERGCVWLGDEPVRPDPESGSLGVRERISLLDDIAFRAAMALLRLGQPEAMRRRWQGPAPRLEDNAMQKIRLINGLFALAGWEPAVWKHYGIPLDELAKLPPPGDPKLAERMLRQVVPHAKAWNARGDVDPEHLSPVLVRALDGLAGLLYELPAELPAQLVAALSKVHPPPKASRARATQDLRESDRRVAAARELLRVRDPVVLEAWARGEHLQRAPGPGATAVYHAVYNEGKDDDSVLTAAWKALPPTPFHHWSEERWQGARVHLLFQGSVRSRGDFVREHPLPYVVDYATNCTDPDQLEHLTLVNGHSQRWLPVLRAHRDRAPDRRSRAYWALQAARLGADADTWRGCVTDWLRDDPVPWAGGEQWRRDSGCWTGGAGDLLAEAAKLARAADVDGIARVFQLALRLPITMGRPSHDSEPASVTLAYNGNLAPWPLRDVAEALNSFDRWDAVDQAYRDPPGGDEVTDVPGARGEPLTRAELVRRCLGRPWVEQAPSQRLLEELWGETGVREFVLHELFHRQDSRVADEARKLVLNLAMPRWLMLASAAPDQLAGALRERLRVSEQPWRLAVAGAEAAAEETGCHAAMIEVRRVIGARAKARDADE